jgi:ribose transport system ATP-binding protein
VEALRRERHSKMDREPILETRELTKRFFGTLALDAVDFSVRAGEIHALVGENGAGKSTLIKILAGVYVADAGEVRMKGQTVHPHAQHLPIAFVHQDIGLVEELSVGENVALVAGFPRRFGLIDWQRVWARAQEIYRLMEVDAPDPRRPVQTLTTAERAVLGIVRALSLEAEIIVLDEPTAALPEPDALLLFGILRNLRANGTSVLYVTHRLSELFGMADRVTVFRVGRLIRTSNIAGVTPIGLVEDMLGRTVESVRIAHHAPTTTVPLLTVRGLHVDRRGPLDFEIGAGEIVGLVGLRGAGQEGIGRAICGAVPRQAGTIRLGQEELRDGEGIAERMMRGIVLVPGDRTRESVFDGMTVTENLFPNPAVVGQGAWSLGFVRREARRVKRLMDEFDIRPRDESAPIDWLSGGNQQKVVLARWIAANARLLVLEEPTAGVDIGAKLAIHQMLRAAADAGAGILVVSSDFEEVATLCDRAIIVNRGRIGGELRGEGLTVDELVTKASIGNAGAGTRAVDIQAMEGAAP